MRRLFISGLLTLFLFGCGYKFGHLMPEGPRTIAIPIFENRTLYRGIEFTLTQAVINEILNKTTLTVAREEVADTILKGVIVKVIRPIITEDESDRPTAFSFNLTVEVEWQSLKNDKRLIPKKIIRDSAEANLLHGENLNTAIEKALSNIARLIVHAMEDPKLLEES